MNMTVIKHSRASHIEFRARANPHFLSKYLRMLNPIILHAYFLRGYTGIQTSPAYPTVPFGPSGSPSQRPTVALR